LKKGNPEEGEFEMAYPLPTNIYDFAKKFVWYDCPERFIKTKQDYKDFLVFLLANAPPVLMEHARKTFHITDDEFRDALNTAKPGIFIYEENWLQCNKNLGIDPSLPFPRKVWLT
jgi:hypothetical protein